MPAEGRPGRPAGPGPPLGRREPGEVAFAAILTVLSVALCIAIPWQTKWFEGTAFFEQPRLWPGISLLGFFIFSIALLMQRARTERAETARNDLPVLHWIAPLEYVAYFLAYVWAVPSLGYLAATLIFALFLALRAGYTSARMHIGAVGFAFAVVLVFKTFLQVKIPGGAIYQYLPAALRNFMMVNF